MFFIHQHVNLNLQDKKWDKELEADVIPITYANIVIGQFVYDRHLDKWGINLSNTATLSQAAIGALWALLWYKLDHPEETVIGQGSND